MRRPPLPAPLAAAGGFAAWGAESGGVRVLFVGRRAGDAPERGLDRQAVLAAVLGEAGAPPVAAARQVHGAGVLAAEAAGPCGDGDALVTARRGLALSVVTADCVPVLVAAGGHLAAIHAGWRGVVAGVVPATAARLRAAGAGDPAGWEAWIGPAIGGCCYEVGEEVAARVAGASTAEAVLPAGSFGGGEGSGDGTGAGRPHLDLAHAVRCQLAAAGVERVAWRPTCTRCDAARLWSYRRDGKGAGRNHAYVWRG